MTQDTGDWSWNNEKCIQVAFQDSFPSAVRDTGFQRIIAINFLDFYIGGKIPKGLDVCDILFASLSVMPCSEFTEEFIWDDSHYDKSGTLFFLTSEEKYKILTNEIKPQHVKTDLKMGTSKSEKVIVENKSRSVFVQKELNGIIDTGLDSSSDLSTEMNNTLSSVYFSDGEEKIFETYSDETGLHFKDTIFTMLPQQEFDFNLKWKIKPSVKKTLENCKPELGPAQNAAFLASCLKFLEEWETSYTSRCTLKYFFGKISLTLMRGVCKRYKHLMNTFTENGNYINTILMTPEIKYFTPHKRCIKRCYGVLGQRDGKIPIMLAKLIINSFHISKDKWTNRAKYNTTQNIFKVTVLNYIADYGIGVVGMLKNIYKETFLLKLFFEITYCSETQESWDRLKKFLMKYESAFSKEKTHPWALLVDKESIRGLSCLSNLALSVVLATFTEKLTKNSSVWNSSWVESANPVDLKRYKKMALDLYEKFELKR